MKKFVTATLASLVLAGLIAIPLSSAKAQAGLVSSLLTKMERNRQSLKTLTADLSMEKYNSQLQISEKYYGNIRYIPAARGAALVRLEWNKPQQEILIIANGGYILYRPRLNQALIGTTNSVRSAKDNDVLSLLNMSAAQLRSRFGDFQDEREETLWGGIHTTHLKAVPKTTASYKYIEVWVDDSGMPVQTKMVEKNDDSTTMRLSNVAKNSNIPMSVFKLDLDSSVRRIKG
ncbi:MAG: outer membrane lipoprotein carrier protein LolA [Pyrinomonadaceae bacterium]